MKGNIAKIFKEDSDRQNSSMRKREGDVRNTNPRKYDIQLSLEGEVMGRYISYAMHLPRGG